MRFVVFVLPIVVLSASAPLSAQTSDVRATRIASAFTKSKDVRKEKRGVMKTKFRDVVSTPWVSAQYAGTYISLGDGLITIRVDDRGNVTGRGFDDADFEIRDASINGALITGKKLYRDGHVEDFEAAFLQRRERIAPDAEYRTSYGIGMQTNAPAGSGVSGPMNTFLEKQ